MSICQFCNQPKKLIDAHIIPWSFYKFLKPVDEKHEPPLLISKDFEERRSKGSYDKNILCAECDNLLGRLDNYGAIALKFENLEIIKTNLAKINNVEYGKFGLFILSIIWRSSVSTRKELNSVTLGKYEDEAKDLLRIAINEKSYISPDYLVVLNKDKKLPIEIVENNIMLPFSYKFHGLNVTQFTLPGGFKIIMKFDKRKFPVPLDVFVSQSKAVNTVHCMINNNFAKTKDFEFMLNLVKG